MKASKSVLLLLIFFQSLIYSQEVKLFNETNSPLTTSDLSSLAIDSSNTIWVGGYSKQLFTYSGEWNSVEDVWNNFDGHGIGDIAISPNGTIWMTVYGDYQGALFSLTTGNPKTLSIESPLRLPNRITIENDSTIYFTLINYWSHQMYADQIGIFSHDSISTYDFTCLNNIVQLAEDTLLVSSCAFGISKFNGDSIIIINPEGWKPLEVNKINNEVFVYSEKLSKYENGKYLEYPKVDSVISSDTSNISSLAIEDEDILWIGTDKGKLIRVDENIEVYKVSNYAIRDINIDQYKNKWFISYDGCFIFNEDQIVEVEKKQSLTISYSLSQNYPNPFNPTTRIKYTIPRSGNVQIRLYDVLGKEVKTLVNEFKFLGQYEIDFYSTNLSSGIYFYRIISRDYSQCKKMLILK